MAISPDDIANDVIDKLGKLPEELEDAIDAALHSRCFQCLGPTVNLPLDEVIPEKFRETATESNALKARVGATYWLHGWIVSISPGNPSTWGFQPRILPPRP